MRIQAQVSIYPLKTEALAQPVEAFCRKLQHPDRTVTRQSMSTLIAGELGGVFQAVRQAFQTLATEYDVVMDLKVSNACPDAVERGRRKKVNDSQ